jgi:sugar/nucleoside kinase (ribokinase family)
VTPEASVPPVVAPARWHDGGPVGLHVGLATLDLVQRVERLPGPDEKVTATRADLAAGGPATNAAVTFAALGGQAVLVTAVGTGPLARVVQDDLAACGVRLLDAAPPGYAVPVSAAAVVEATGERSVVSRNAVGADVGVPAGLPALVEDAAVVLVDGHHPALALAAAAAAVARGVPVVLDAGSWKPVLSRLLPLVTLAVCSQSFTLPASFALPASSTLPGSVVPPGASTQGVAALLAAGPVFVVVTAGSRPVRWWTEGASGHVDVPAVDALDTHGAGDVLHGAFAHALACGADPVEALRAGVAVAALRVQHVGPRSWLGSLPGALPPGP